ASLRPVAAARLVLPTPPLPLNNKILILLFYTRFPFSRLRMKTEGATSQSWRRESSSARKRFADYAFVLGWRTLRSRDTNAALTCRLPFFFSLRALSEAASTP